MRSHASYLFLVLSVPVIAVIGGCSPETPPEKTPPKVTISKPIVQENEVDADEHNGWLAAKDPVEVRPKVSGYLKTIHFKDPPEGKPGEGEIVKKGTPLFDLDPDDFQDKVVQAQEKVNVYKAQKVAADKESARLTDLEKKGGASRAQVEKADADAKSLEAQVKAAETEVKLRERDRDEYAKIKAPIEGRVGRSNYPRGYLVKAGETLLTTINSVDPIKLEFHVDEQTVQRYRQSVSKKAKGGKIPTLKESRIPFKFALDSDNGFVREEVIDFADNQTDKKTGKILVRGEAKNANGLLLPGDHVRVRVPVSEPYRALLVPDTAVNTDQDKKYLFVVGDKNIVERRDVRLGKLTDNGLRVVETNLKPTDQVIIDGTQRARTGFPVTPEEKDLATEMKKLASSK